MHLMPLYDKIVVRIKEKQEITTSAGLKFTIDMGTNKNTTMTAEVVAKGNGRLLADGNIVPLKVEVGDIVLYSKLQGESYTDETGSYTILSESNILAIIEEV